MRSLADFEFNKVPLCDGMILISEMIRDDFTSQYVYAELENLVSLAREEINQARPQDWQLEKLIELFYGEWGFCDTRGVYRLSDALWLDQVLKIVRAAPSRWAPFYCGLRTSWIFHWCRSFSRRR